MDGKFFVSWLSYYYESVILVIHTHKSTLALISTFSCPKLLRTRLKLIFKVKLEMKNKSSCLNGLLIPHFLVELLSRDHNVWSYTHTKAPYHLSNILVFQNCSDPVKNNSVKLNDKRKLSILV